MNPYMKIPMDYLFNGVACKQFIIYQTDFNNDLYKVENERGEVIGSNLNFVGVIRLHNSFLEED